MTGPTPLEMSKVAFLFMSIIYRRYCGRLAGFGHNYRTVGKKFIKNNETAPRYIYTTSRPEIIHKSRRVSSCWTREGALLDDTNAVAYNIKEKQLERPRLGSDATDGEMKTTCDRSDVIKW